MSVTLQRVDTDLSTVLLDLNAGYGAATGFEVVQDLDLGDITAANTYVRDLGPETTLAATDHALVDVKFSLTAKHTSVDNLRTLAQSLATYLDLPGTYKFQTTGMASPLYFDAFRGDIPQLLHGQENALYWIVTALRTKEGIPVVLHRLPYFYGAAVSSSATVVVNDPSSGTNKRLFTLSVSGNMQTRANIKIAAEAGAKMVQDRIARRSHGDTTSFTTNWYQRAAGGGIGGASADVSDAAATSGTGLNITSSNATAFLRRRRWAISPGTPSGIEGTFRVYGRFKRNGTGDDTYDVQLRWAAGNIDPAPLSNDHVTLTYVSGTAAFYGMVDLGTVTVDTGLGTTYGLALEVWGNRTSGSDDLYLDYVNLMPTAGAVGDQMVTIAVRGFRDAPPSPVAYKGSQLVGGSTFGTPAGLNDGLIQGGAYYLEDTDQSAGLPPATGISMTAGRYVVSADVTLLRTVSAAAQTIGFLIAYNKTDSTEIAEVPIRFPGTATRRDYIATLTFDLTATKTVLIYIRQTLDSQKNTIIRNISFAQQPALGSGNEMNLNGDYAINAANPAAYVTASGTYSQPLSQSGAFIDLNPGTNILIFDWGEQPPASADIDVREPVPQSNLTRNATVTVTYYPRYSN